MHDTPSAPTMPPPSLLGRLLTALRLIIIFHLTQALLSGFFVNSPWLALPVSAAIMALGWWAMRHRAVRTLLHRGLTAAPEEAAPLSPLTRADWLWYAVGAGVFFAGLIIVEWHQPTFFTQDDNFAIGLPFALQACRSLFSGHGLCTINPYQMMGLPIASNPQSYFLYPPLYLAYAVARYLFGNEYLTMEVYALLHLVAGFFFTLRLTRELRISAPIAAAAACAFWLSGFTLILGRSWSSALIVTIYLIPLLIAFVILVRRPVTWKWALWTGVAIGASLYCGFPQQWVYNIIFIALAALLAMSVRTLSWRRALWLLPALGIGLAIAAPQLAPSVLETRRFYGGRNIEMGQGIANAVGNLFLPWPLAKPVKPELSRELVRYGPLYWKVPGYEDSKSPEGYMGEICYAGTLFSVVGALLLLLSVGYRWNRRTVADNILLVCAWVALVLVLGEPGGVWDNLSMLPLFDKFRGAFKLLGVFQLFLILGGGLVLTRIFRSSTSKAHSLKRYIPAFLLATVAALMLYHCMLPLPAFFLYPAGRYAPPAPQLAALIGAGADPAPARIFSETPFHDQDGAPDFCASLPLNMPTVYRVPCLYGYEPLMELTSEYQAVNVNLLNRCPEALTAYGVRWILHNRTIVGSFGWKTYLLRSHPDLVTLRAVVGNVEVWELHHYDPLAFPEGHPSAPLSVHLTPQGADVDLASLPAGGAIVVNMLAQPWYHGTAVMAAGDGGPPPGGTRVALGKDTWGRITATVPAGTRTLRVVYAPPWGLGWLAALILGALAALLTCWVAVVQRVPRQGSHEP